MNVKLSLMAGFHSSSLKTFQKGTVGASAPQRSAEDKFTAHISPKKKTGLKTSPLQQGFKTREQPKSLGFVGVFGKGTWGE